MATLFSTTKRHIAIEYLNCFCKGDIEGIESLLDPEFSLKGPLFEFDSRADYISSLRTDPPDAATLDLIHVSESDSVVSIFYTYRKTSVTTTVAQLFRFEDDKIKQTLLVFDSGSVA